MTNPQVGNDRFLQGWIRPLQALSMARTGSVWGSFVQLKLNVTVPCRARGWPATPEAAMAEVTIREGGAIPQK